MLDLVAQMVAQALLVLGGVGIVVALRPRTRSGSDREQQRSNLVEQHALTG
ncbi:hypothetical protein BH11GEM2_BH11GEM2_33320 [soil metagenome]